MTKKEKRQFIRHPLSLPLAYEVVNSKVQKDDEDNRSETINVSIGGLLFPGRNPVDVDSIISIKMPFEDKLF